MAMELDFEKPVVELERKIEELKTLSSDKHMDLSGEIKKLQEKLEKAKKTIYAKLKPWQRIQLARHPQRPYTLDYVGLLMGEFVELHGDRLFGDDKALLGGFAKLDDTKVMVLGHQKGRDTKENLMRNFGSAHPEGYRKALRLMKMAEKFKLPIVIFIDTPGAYPGIGAEERGQSSAIAVNLWEMARIKVPIVCVVIGEGGSGGALGIGVGDRVAVLENSYYSVISPEGCAAILWKERTKAPEAAEALKLTAEELLKNKLIDEMISEPAGGAHRDPETTAANVRQFIKKSLKQLQTLSPEKLIKERYEKYRKIGLFEDESASKKIS